MGRHGADDLAARASSLMSRGEHLAAYDLLAVAARSSVLEPALEHLRILALARAGSPDQALAALDASALEARLDVLDPQVAEDVMGLRARLDKDLAFASGDEGLLRSAARAYEAASARFGRPYTTVNAATMWAILGERERARSLATDTRSLLEGTDDGSYWSAASAAEAALVLGDAAAASDALREASRRSPRAWSTRAGTRRQLHRLCVATGVDPDVLEPLDNASVVHFCGHMALPPGVEPGAAWSTVAEEVQRWASDHPVGSAWGSLARGADIVVAEALADLGADLHIVLPFAVPDFVEVSVRPGGDEWVGRFERCLERADEVVVCCDSPYLGDDSLFEHASRVAMGQVRRRARELAVEPVQLAVWDGRPASGPAGAANDVDIWRRSGGATQVVGRSVTGVSTGPVEARVVSTRRPVAAVLFGDLHGISRLDDGQFIPFVEHVLGGLARVIEAHGDDVIARNTWGDAVFVACRTVSSAASLALELQEAMSRFDLPAMGLPDDLLMRLAGHAGPVLSMADPVRGTTGLFGRELTRAARIEPRTPPGEVYVTDQFAALLSLDGDGSVVPEYVGHLETAKRFERIPMYLLRRSRR